MVVLTSKRSKEVTKREAIEREIKIKLKKIQSQTKKHRLFQLKEPDATDDSFFRTRPMCFIRNNIKSLVKLRKIGNKRRNMLHLSKRVPNLLI